MVVCERDGKRLIELSPVAVLLGGYLVYNRVSVGVLLPLSGTVKAGLGLVHNAASLLRMFLPVVTGGSAKALLSPSYSYSEFSEIAVRMVQMVLPAVLCGVELWLLVRRRGGWRNAGVVHALALGVIAKAAYNFLFVQFWNQGMWYYTVSITVANLILVIWLDDATARWHREPGTRHLPRWALLAAHGLLVLLAFNVFISARNFAGPKEEVKLLLDKSPLEAELTRLGAKRIIEFDDGFTSYVADVPAAAAFGLALDHEAAQALKKGQFLPLLQQRGYRIAVAHGDYATAMDATLAQAAAGGRPALLWAIRGAELDRYTFRPLGGDGSDDRLSYYELVRLR